MANSGNTTLSVVQLLNVDQLAAVIKNRIDKVLIIDSRSFLEFNTYHILHSVNVCCSKIVKRRLQQDKLSVKEFLVHTCQIEADESYDVIVYDQGSEDISLLSPDSFVYVLLKKLSEVFKSVSLLKGGFLQFQGSYPGLCEDKTRKCPSLTSLSQPCLPISNLGPTRILPFLYLGSQNDAMNKELLKDHNITYELNVSTTCPKPDFIQDHQFLRISVNDNYSEKLLPHFPKAFNFLDKVQESNGCVLVHCLAGISRSPTIAIAYVMRHLNMTSEEGYRYVKSKRATISPNFNFLGQLLEYEKQLKAENVLRRPTDIASAPVLSNGNKRQCCTDMRKSARNLTLNLPSPTTTTATTKAASHSSHNFISSPFSPSSSDLSPTTGISKLSFVSDENETPEDAVTKEKGCGRWERTGKGGGGGNVLGIQDQRGSVSRSFKTQLTFMTSVKEESCNSKVSYSSSSYVINKSSCVESSAKITTTSTKNDCRGTNTGSQGTRPSFITYMNVVPCTHSLTSSNCGSEFSSHETSPEKEADESLAGGRSWSLPLSRGGEKRPCSSTDTASCRSPSSLDGVESLTSSQCTTSSMCGSWNALSEEGSRSYCRSNSTSTSGVGSEASDFDIMPDGTSLGVGSEQACDDDNKSSNHFTDMVVDNVHVALRKPLQLLPNSWSRNSLSKGVRDSGNPQSPLENFPTDGSMNDSFGFWEKDGYAGKKKAYDSGIVDSPTWGGANFGFSMKCSQEGYFSEQKQTSSTTFVSRESPLSGVGKSASDPQSCSISTALRSEKVESEVEKKKKKSQLVTVTTTCQVDGHHDQKSSSKVVLEKMFDKLQKAHSKEHCTSLGKKDDGLYRAQSCPGIMGPSQCTTASSLSLESPLATPSSLLTSSPRLRGLHFTSVERAEKFRNRYSCGSLDYGDLGRIFFDSCPDFGHIGRCQSSGTIATIADRSPVTPSHHQAFNGNISIIQVS